MIILGQGAIRMSARELEARIETQRSRKPQATIGPRPLEELKKKWEE